MVTELATTVKYEAERGKEDRASVNDMVDELRILTQQMGEIKTIQKQIMGIVEEQAKQQKDIASSKESIGTMLQTKEKLDDYVQQFIELRATVTSIKEWKDKHNLSAIEVKVDELNTWKTLKDGGEKVVEKNWGWFKELFGPVISSAITLILGGALAYFFYTKNDDESISRRTVYQSKEVIEGDE